MSTFLRIFGLLLFAMALFLYPAKGQAAARLSLSPASNSYKIGDTVTVTALLNTGGQSINATEGSISFPTDLLEYQSVSTSSSIFSFWTSGPTVNSGTLIFGGGLSQPGYNGSEGNILTLSFKTKSSGTATVQMKGSKVLLNDGSGTDIYGSSSNASYTISATGGVTGQTPSPSGSKLKILSSTHPDSTKWYSNKTVDLEWSSSLSATGFISSFSRSATDSPTTPVLTEKKHRFESTADGIWYFHLRAQINGKLTDAVHYKVQIDTVVPDPFTVTITQLENHTDPSPTVSFTTTDQTSGIDHYEGTIDDGTPFTLTSGDRLPKQTPGDHKLSLSAIDKAGNKRTIEQSYYINGIEPPSIILVPKTVGLLNSFTLSGRALPDDTVSIYLNSKKVDSFKAIDKKVGFGPQLIERAAASEDQQITWEYLYSEPLIPGDQQFQFSRTDKDGAESALSEPYIVHVAGSTIQLNGKTVETRPIFIGLVSTIIVLIGIIIYLIARLRRLRNATRVTKKKERLEKIPVA